MRSAIRITFLALLAIGVCWTVGWLLSASSPPTNAFEAEMEERQPDWTPAPAAPDGPQIRVLVSEEEDEDDPDHVTDRDALPSEARTATLSIRVIGPGGRAVSGATVALIPDRNAPSLDAAMRSQVECDATGRCQFSVPPTGRFTVLAEAAGLRPRTVGPIAPGSSITVELSARNTRAGEVVSGSSGGPIRGALVLQETETGWSESHTGGEGRFTIDLAPRGGRIEVLAVGYVAKSMWVAPGAQALRVELADAEEISGRVVDERGSGVANARVQLLAERTFAGDDHDVSLYETQTAADGSFRVALGSTDDTRLVADAGARGKVSRDVDDLPDGEVLLEIQRGRRVSGIASLADGTPAAGAWVRLFGASADEAARRLTRTDRDGRFDLPWVIHDDVELGVSHPDATPCLIDLPSDADSEGLRVQLAPPNAVTGTVRFEGGAVAPHALVWLTCDPQLRRASRARSSVRADEDGRFRFVGLLPGTYQLRAEHGAATSMAALIEVTEAADQALDLVLDAGTGLAGRVIDATARPVVGAVIRATSEVDAADATVRDAAISDDDGRFRLSRFEVGEEVELVVLHDDYVRHETTLVVTPRPVELSLIGAAALTGQVLDARTARPVVRFSVMVDFEDSSGEEDTRKRGFLSPDGRFEFEGFAPGTTEVTIESDGYFRSDAIVVDVGPAVPPTTFRLSPAALLSGRVIDTARRPITGVFASLSPSGEWPEDERPKPRRSRTREDGVFRLRELPPGEYRLSIGEPDAPAFRRDLTLGFGTEELPDIVIEQLGSIDLRVFEASGDPAREQDVVITGVGLESRRLVETDERGECVIDSLLVDEYQISCDDARQLVSVSAGRRATVQIVLPEETDDDDD